MLIDRAECPKMTPNIQTHRSALIDRKSLESSVFELVSSVNLYQFLGNEKLTKVAATKISEIKFYYYLILLTYVIMLYTIFIRINEKR